MIIQSKQVYINERFTPSQIEIKNGKIKALHIYDARPVDVDYGNRRIVPGFYDIHTHGYDGFDTNDADPEGLKKWLRGLPAEGVCGICPTTITQSVEVLTAACSNVAEVCDSFHEGAQILGIHFEGPYLDQKFKGAQPERYCVKPSVAEFAAYQQAARGRIRIITLAPEHDDGFRLCSYCASHGVNVSLGHSGASFEVARMALQNGARSFTHVFNGMSPFNHRANGMVGAALVSDEAYSELICDGLHTTIAAIQLFFKCKPKEKAIMISDSLMAKNRPAGERMLFGGQEIEICEDGACRLTSTGGLAGSTLKLNEGLRILVEKAGIPFPVAIASCTINPMRYLNLDDHKGLLKRGYDADIAVLEDDYRVADTYCRGQRYQYC